MTGVQTCALPILADGFIAMPGGFGTLEELAEVTTWSQLGLHAKPVVLLDVAGFWDPLVAQLEDELYGLLNETGIGPMGLGGDVTVLNCHIEHADTHMTLNPVAVNYQCWAARRASAHIAADGTTDFDREA